MHRFCLLNISDFSIHTIIDIISQIIGFRDFWTGNRIWNLNLVSEFLKFLFSLRVPFLLRGGFREYWAIKVRGLRFWFLVFPKLYLSGFRCFHRVQFYLISPIPIAYNIFKNEAVFDTEWFHNVNWSLFSSLQFAEHVAPF